MAKILAIDTSTNACSVALLQDGSVSEDFIVVPQSHTQRLLPMVDKLLSDHQQELGKLDAIALTTGPGSFTGLRIGLGIAQGLAFGADIPTIGVSSLQVMALSAKRILQLDDEVNVIPCFDARMNEVYWGHFEVRGSALKGIVDDKVSSSAVMLDYLADSPVYKTDCPIVGVGNGWALIPDDDIKKLKIDTDFYPHAHDLALLAEQKLKDGEGQSALDINPVYIRNEVSWKKRQKIRQ